MPRLSFLANAASSHTQKWAAGLARRGWHVDVFSFLPADIPGVTVHLIPKLLGGKADALLRARWVRKQVQKLRPDIVHAHYATSFGLLGVLAGIRPLVISAWGSDIFSFPRTSILHRFLLQWILKQADVLCSTSRVMAEEMRLYLDFAKKIEVIPFGVDVAHFSPPEKPEQANTEPGSPDRAEFVKKAVVFGVAKHLHPVYGLDLLLKAFAQVYNHYPGEVMLRIAGDGPERENLQQLSRELGLAEKVDWIGSLPNKEVADFYRSLDVVVVPSRQESFGVTAVEGASCARPVIGSRVGGLPEVIEDKKTGLLVPSEDVEELAKAMEFLLLNPEERFRMGQAGRKFVLENYAWEKNISQMEEVYLRLLKS